MNQFSKIIENKWFGAILTFLVSLGVYLKTLCPTIYLEDSGEFVTGAYTLGILHPPGYPLYAILGKLFTFLPLGSIAFRVNLMSAIFASLTVLFLYLIVFKLTQNKIISFVAALIWAFSPIFWSQAVIAEVYTLNAFFVSLTFYLLLEWRENKKEKYLFGIALLLGLGATNHQSILLLIPLYFLFILLEDKRIWKKIKLLLKMFLSFILGLSLYLYLPIRALGLDPSDKNVLNTGNPANWPNFLNVILRQQYPDAGFDFSNIYERFFYVVSFLEQFRDQFTLFFIIIGVLGLLYLYIVKRDKKLSLSLFLIFFILVLSFVFLDPRYSSNIEMNFRIAYSKRVFYIPVYFFFAVWIGLGLKSIWIGIKWIVKKFNLGSLKIFISLIASLIILFIPLYFIQKNFYQNNKSNFYLNYDYGKNVLESLDQNAVLVLQDVRDSEIFSLLYFQMVEKLREDVTIISDKMSFNILESLPNFPFSYDYAILSLKDQKKALIGAAMVLADQGKKPIYTTFLPGDSEEIDYIFRSNGIVYQVYQDEKEAEEEIKKFQPAVFRNIKNNDIYQDKYFANDLITDYFYNLAAFYLQKGEKEKSQKYFHRALEIDPSNFSSEYGSYMSFRGKFIEENRERFGWD